MTTQETIINALAETVRKAEAKTANLPAAPEDVVTMLDELALADKDMSAHFDRFADERNKEWEAQSEECRADWSRCLRRKDRAVAALVKYATLRMATKEAA